MRWVRLLAALVALIVVSLFGAPVGNATATLQQPVHLTYARDHAQIPTCTGYTAFERGPQARGAFRDVVASHGADDHRSVSSLARQGTSVAGTTYDYDTTPPLVHDARGAAADLSSTPTTDGVQVRRPGGTPSFLAPGSVAAETGAGETTTLFRALGQHEADDIAAAGG